MIAYLKTKFELYFCEDCGNYFAKVESSLPYTQCPAQGCHSQGIHTVDDYESPNHTTHTITGLPIGWGNKKINFS